MTAWTDTSTGIVVKEVSPNSGLKIIHVKTGAGYVAAADTMAVDLKKFGANQCIGVLMFQETTAGSIIQQSAIKDDTGGVVGFTTAVVTGVLTITTKLPAVTCTHSFIIFAI
jgi:hypothetical protein